MTETKKTTVTPEMKEKRANEIAEALSANERWHSHGRGIDMKTLIDEVGLKIEDYRSINGLGPIVAEYFELLQDYLNREQMYSFIHTKEIF